MNSYKITKIAIIGPNIQQVRDFGYLEVVGPRGGVYLMDPVCAKECLELAFHVPIREAVLSIANMRPTLIKYLIKTLTQDDLEKKARSSKAKKLLIGRQGLIQARTIANSLESPLK